MSGALLSALRSLTHLILKKKKSCKIITIAMPHYFFTDKKIEDHIYKMSCSKSYNCHRSQVSFEIWADSKNIY